jgi:hypothetical protein
MHFLRLDHAAYFFCFVRPHLGSQIAKLEVPPLLRSSAPASSAASAASLRAFFLARMRSISLARSPLEALQPADFVGLCFDGFAQQAFDLVAFDDLKPGIAGLVVHFDQGAVLLEHVNEIGVERNFPALSGGIAVGQVIVGFAAALRCAAHGVACYR